MGAKAAEAIADPQGMPVETYLAIQGMTCSHCARTVTEALQAVPGVQSVDVDLDKGQAVVRWLPDALADEGALYRSVRQNWYQC